MGILLDSIHKAGDIKKIDPAGYPQLAQEIREFLVDKVSRTGGHLASNLGAVELTMGLHLALDLPNDKIIWDVGHQSYTHKILTGRKESPVSRGAGSRTVTRLIRVTLQRPSPQVLDLSAREICWVKSGRSFLS